jgi:hypothetical protein
MWFVPSFILAGNIVCRVRGKYGLRVLDSERYLGLRIMKEQETGGN